MVVDRHRERALGALLANDVFLQRVEDFLRLGQLEGDALFDLGQFFFDDLVAKFNALGADVDAVPGDQFANLLLALAAEGTLEQIRPFTHACHRVGPLIWYR